MRIIIKIILTIPFIYWAFFMPLNFINLLGMSFNTYVELWIIGVVMMLFTFFYLIRRVSKKTISKEKKQEIILYMFIFVPYMLYYIWYLDDKSETELI